MSSSTSTPADDISGLLSRLAELAPKPGDSVATMRREHEAQVASLPVPADVRIDECDADGARGEWVRLATSDPTDSRVVLYLHGGGYVMGSPASGRPLSTQLARAADVPVLSLSYRLAPEAPFPAALEDAVAAVAWLVATGHDPRRIVLAGDSAGGGLAVATLVALRDRGSARLGGAICLSPWADLTLPDGSVDGSSPDPVVSRWLLQRMADHYAGGLDSADPLVSPARANLAGLPPLLIQAGSRERLLDDSTRLAERARAAGVDADLQVYEGMFHVWHAFAPRLRAANAAFQAIHIWLRDHVRGWQGQVG